MLRRPAALAWARADAISANVTGPSEAALPSELKQEALHAAKASTGWGRLPRREGHGCRLREFEKRGRGWRWAEEVLRDPCCARHCARVEILVRHFPPAPLQHPQEGPNNRQECAAGRLLVAAAQGAGAASLWPTKVTNRLCRAATTRQILRQTGRQPHRAPAGNPRAAAHSCVPTLCPAHTRRRPGGPA